MTTADPFDLDQLLAATTSQRSPAEDRPDAQARLEALRRTGLGAAADEAFDRFAAMVRTMLGVPVALVSLITDDRQVFPGALGLAEPWQQVRHTPPVALLLPARGYDRGTSSHYRRS